MKTFEVGDQVIFWNGESYFYDAIIVDNKNAPFYAIRIGYDDSVKSDIMSSGTPNNLYKNTSDGLHELKLEIKQRIKRLINLVEDVDLLIKSAEEK